MMAVLIHIPKSSMEGFLALCILTLTSILVCLFVVCFFFIVAILGLPYLKGLMWFQFAFP